MKVLLDENFPLGFVRALKDHGIEVDHIIRLGWLTERIQVWPGALQTLPFAEG